MRKKLFFALLILPLSRGYAQAPAVPEAIIANCRWAAEGTNPNFAAAPIYKAAPRLVATSACSLKGTARRSCSGYAYCRYEKKENAPNVRLIACFAVNVGGKWICPTAMDCARDAEVDPAIVSRLPRRNNAPEYTEDQLIKQLQRPAGAVREQ